MRMRAPFVASVGLCLLSSAAFAAPTVSAPIDVAPRLFVPSDYTSEPALSITSGAGKIAVLTGGERLTLLNEDLSFVGEPQSRTFAASNVAFDGNDFLLATFAAQAPSGGKDYLAALELQRLAPDGSLKDPAITLGNVHESGTFESKVAIACKAPGDCLVAYSMRLYGNGGQTDKDIWVAPVKDGKPGTSVQLTTAASDQVSPSITWDGTNWIVVWVDLRFATYDPPEYKDSQIYGARVTAAGASLDPIGVPLATYGELADTTYTYQSNRLPEGIALAHSGGTTLLAWRGAASNRIIGRRLGSDLALLDATPIVMAAPGASWAEVPRLLPAIDGFTAIVGESGSGFGATNVDILGIGLDGKPKAAPAKAGTRFGYQVFAARLSDNTFALAKTVPGPENNSLGDPYTDTWVEKVNAAGSELASAYVTKALTVVDGRALAQAPGIGVVVYADNRTGNNGQYPTRQVFAAVLGNGGTVLPAAGQLLTAPPRNLVTAAAGANHALVAWEEGTYPSRNVVGVLLDATGSIVKNLTFGAAAYDESTPQAAFDGQRFVVSWVDRGNGYDAGVFRRVASDGAFVDPAFIFVAPGQTSTTTIEELVCNENGGCLARSGSSYYLLQNGAVTTSKSAYEVGISGFDNPLLAGGGSGFALMTEGAGYEDIALIRLGSDLSVKDDPAVVLFDANYVNSLVPDAMVVGWNGGRFVTAWSNDKGVSLASLPEAGSASLPYLLTKPAGVPGPYSSIGNEAARNLLVSGESDRTVVGYQDTGRLIVRSITALEDDGTGGAAGAGGSAGTGGTAGSSGNGGAGGSSGQGGAGGSAGSTGGSAGQNQGGSAGQAGAGTGGTAGAGGASAGGSGQGGSGTGGELPGSGGESGEAGAAGESSMPADQSGDDGGCGCRTAGGDTTQSPWGWAGLLLGLGLIGRRRARR